MELNYVNKSGSVDKKCERCGWVHNSIYVKKQLLGFCPQLIKECENDLIWQLFSKECN